MQPQSNKGESDSCLVTLWVNTLTLSLAKMKNIYYYFLYISADSSMEILEKLKYFICWQGWNEEKFCIIKLRRRENGQNLQAFKV